MIEEALRGWIDEALGVGVPGISIRAISNSVDVSAHGGHFALGGGRSMDASARFPISCIVKSLIAVIVIQDFLQGRLDIDLSVGHYLPELRSEPDADARITVRHLLNHTGGFRDPEGEIENWETFAALFRNREQLFPPGVVWSYSHASFIILAEILIREHKMPLLEILQARIFDQIGIEGADVAPSRDDAAQHQFHAPSGRWAPYRLRRQADLFQRTMSDVHLTVDDIAKIASYLCGLGEAGGRLAAEVRALLLAPSINLPAYFYAGPSELMPESYGLGLGMIGGAYGQNGSKAGSTCTLRFDPTRGVVVVVAMNVYNPVLRDFVALRALSALSDWRWSPKRPIRTDLESAAVEGAYRGLMRETAWARVGPSGDLEAEMFGQLVRQQLTISDGLFELQRAKVAVPIGLATLPSSGEPVLMVSASAFRRMGPSA